MHHRSKFSIALHFRLVKVLRIWAGFSGCIYATFHILFGILDEKPEKRYNNWVFASIDAANFRLNWGKVK